MKAVRTCLGCRHRDIQPHLLRVVRNASGDVEVDLQRRKPGRGAWLHPRQECVASALKRKAFARAFKASVNTERLMRDFV